MGTSNKELSRVAKLYDLDLEYLNLEDEFKHITELVSKITGADVSLVNIIDANTLWPISHHGLRIPHQSVENSVCQYTIEEDHLEIKDLTQDDRFKHKQYVKAFPFFKYYLGVPLKTKEGVALGSLCVFDPKSKIADPSQIDLMKVIAVEVTSKLDMLKEANLLRKELSIAKNVQKDIATQIRDPLAGIIGLSDLLLDQINELRPDEAAEFIYLINDSAKSILQNTDAVIEGDVLEKEDDVQESNIFGLISLKEKLTDYYAPLAAQRNVHLEIEARKIPRDIKFLRYNLMMIIGNLISDMVSNAEPDSHVAVSLDVRVMAEELFLIVQLRCSRRETPGDTENSITQGVIEQMGGTFEATNYGEKGRFYNLSIPVVAHS